MGLVEIAVSVAAALLVGALTRGTWRTNLLLVLSVLGIYWLQPAIPLRSFDFWLPSFTLASCHSDLVYHITTRTRGAHVPT